MFFLSIFALIGVVAADECVDSLGFDALLAIRCMDHGLGTPAVRLTNDSETNAIELRAEEGGTVLVEYDTELARLYLTSPDAARAVVRHNPALYSISLVTSPSRPTYYLYDLPNLAEIVLLADYDARFVLHSVGDDSTDGCEGVFNATELRGCTLMKGVAKKPRALAKTLTVPAPVIQRTEIAITFGVAGGVSLFLVLISEILRGVLNLDAFEQSMFRKISLCSFLLVLCWSWMILVYLAF